MLPSSAPLNSMEMLQFGPKDTAGGAAVKRLTHPDVGPGSGKRRGKVQNAARRDREINRRINAPGFLIPVERQLPTTDANVRETTHLDESAHAAPNRLAPIFAAIHRVDHSRSTPAAC
jgi:hypothetical protein